MRSRLAVASRLEAALCSDERRRGLRAIDMRRDVQEIFKKTPREKQVMFFSATLSPEIRIVCKKFMQDVRAWRCLPSLAKDC